MFIKYRTWKWYHIASELQASKNGISSFISKDTSFGVYFQSDSNYMLNPFAASQQGYDEKKEIAAILQKMPKPKLSPPQQN